MRFFACLAAASVFIFACSSTEEGPKALPAPPASVEAAGKDLRTKKYEVEDVGFINTFMNEERTIKWSGEMTDTGSVYREFLEDRKSFSLQFLNDSIVKVVDDKKGSDAHYSLEGDTSKAVLLNIKMEDAGFSFAGSGPALVTYTYTIRGIEGGKLLLQTPRNFNRMDVVVLMKQK